MGNQQDAEKKEDGLLKVQNWYIYKGERKIDTQISGLFYNDFPYCPKKYRSFYADDERIYFQDGATIKCLPLFFTRMQQKFYYHKGQHIYAFKLIHNSSSTTLSTTDRKMFVNFYCYLAQYCILGDFQRHFEVKQILGKGSYGTVYRGINKLSSEEVALKVFYKDKLKQNTNCRKVVQNQMYILKKLKRANLSPLYEIFETSDCLILVIQMAKEGDLINYLLREQTVINDKLIKHILEKILENLNALHVAGFVHRDIKPDNVLFKHANGQIKLFICDFSITIALEDRNCKEMREMQAGSRGFVAPQVLGSNEYDYKCDIFSYGCLVYLLLSGKKLFQNISNREIVMLTQDNQFIHRQIEHLSAPKSLKELLKKLLEVDPIKRINAQQALNDEYFSDKEDQILQFPQGDETLKQFIEKRIVSYQGSTGGGTSF